MAQFIREEMFIFQEDQRIDLTRRYSESSCDNKVLEGLIKAHRSANMRADPNNPHSTIFEQTMSISFSSAFGKTIKTQLELFAEGLFLSTAQSGTAILEQSLAEDAANKAALAEQSNGGGGIWWTGGHQTSPSASLYQQEPAVPEDSSSGYFGETLDSWTSWMWPSSYFSSDADTPAPAASTRAQVSSGPSGGCSVWWNHGEEGGALHDVRPHDVIETPEGGSTSVSGIVGIGMCSKDGEGEGEGGEGQQRRQPLRRIKSLVRHAGSPAVMLAGIAAQVVSSGEHHFGDSPKQWKDITRAKSFPLKRSSSHPELKEVQGAGGVARFPPQAPPQLRQMGVHVKSQVVGAAGAAAAFVSSSSDISFFI